MLGIYPFFPIMKAFACLRCLLFFRFLHRYSQRSHFHPSLFNRLYFSDKSLCIPSITTAEKDCSGSDDIVMIAYSALSSSSYVTMAEYHIFKGLAIGVSKMVEQKEPHHVALLLLVSHLNRFSR